MPAAHLRSLSLLLAAAAALSQPAHVSAAGNTQGKWSPVKPLPLIPVAVALLHTNELLMWSAYLPDGNPTPFPGSHAYTQTATLNLTSKVVTRRNVTQIGHDMFCPGTAMLADGRVHVVGGANDQAVSIYNPDTRAWITGNPTHFGRGYSGDVTLSDGRVVTFGGTWGNSFGLDTAGSRVAEVWSPATRQWSVLANVTADSTLTNPLNPNTSNYRWLFAMNDGAFFVPGPSNVMRFFTTKGAGGEIAAGTRPGGNDDYYSRAVMFAPGQILAVTGTKPNKTSAGINDAHLITMGASGTALTPPSVQAIAPLNFPRAFSNSVLLPTGDVIIFGGQQVPLAYRDDNSVLVPELWSPKTRTWTVLAAATTPRNYHSVAILLPDCTMFVGGGGLCLQGVNLNCPNNTQNHLDYEVFTPPCLLNADGSPAARPAILTAPATAGHNATILVATDRPVAYFSLVRTSSTTHGSNNDQRRVVLPLIASAADSVTYTLGTPANRGIVVAGYHLLFAVDSLGVPSVGKFIRIV